MKYLNETPPVLDKTTKSEKSKYHFLQSNYQVHLGKKKSQPFILQRSAGIQILPLYQQLLLLKGLITWRVSFFLL